MYLLDSLPNIRKIISNQRYHQSMSKDFPSLPKPWISIIFISVKTMDLNYFYFSHNKVQNCLQMGLTWKCRVFDLGICIHTSINHHCQIWKKRWILGVCSWLRKCLGRGGGTTLKRFLVERLIYYLFYVAYILLHQISYPKLVPCRQLEMFINDKGGMVECLVEGN